MGNCKTCHESRYSRRDFIKKTAVASASLGIGINYRECGLVKLYKAHGVEEFTPYLCLTDYSLLSLLDIELKRTQTIANGGSFCDFRFSKNDKGPSGWPPESLPEWTGKFEQ